MIILFFTVFIDLVGFGIVIPLLPFYAQRFGATPDVVTLVVASFALTQFLFAPVWGRLSDRIGRRRILLLTLFGITLGYVWLGLSDSLWMLFLARAFGGAMAGNVAVAQAYVADISSPETRARDLGRIGAASGLGFVTGPAIGGILVGPDAQNPDFQLPFFIAAALSFGAFLFALARLRETVPAETRERARAEKGRGRTALFAETVRRPQLGFLVGLMFMMPFVFGGMESTFALWSERTLGWGPQTNGYMYAYMGLVAVIVQGGLIGPLTAWLGERGLLRLGPLICGFGMAWMPFTAGTVALCMAVGMIVFGVCVTGPSLSSLMSKHAEAHERGSVLGVGQSSSGLGRIAGPAWAGFAFAAFGRDWPYFSGAMVMALMVALSLRVSAPIEAESAEQKTPEQD